MIIPKGVDASPYTLTEPRELVLRATATAAGVELDRPLAWPVPLRPQDIADARRWLYTHDYLDQDGPTNRGRQVAQHLSRADRHDPIASEAAVANPLQGGQLTSGTRVRCSCGWGGARNEQGPAELRVPFPPHRGGRQAAERLHAAHAWEARGEAPPAKPAPRGLAGIPDAPSDDW